MNLDDDYKDQLDNLSGIHNQDLIQLNVSQNLKDKYILLVFYPGDFTFVCPTELNAFSDAYGDFVNLNTEVLFVSTDSKHVHLAWSKVPRARGGIEGIRGYMIEDLGGVLSNAFDVYNYNSKTAMRATILLDKNLDVKHKQINADPIGRNVDETLRTIKALQAYEKSGLVCPANWNKGDRGINTDPTKARSYFSRTYKKPVVAETE